MENRVLVAYATKYGATAEIAQAIGETLRNAGMTVDVEDVDQADAATIYDAVVLGSAVYAGHWRKEAVEYLDVQKAALADRPVWLFSSGPTAEGDPVEAMDGWRFPEGQQPLADQIGPRDIAVFGGCIDPDKLNLGEKLILKAVKAQTGDFRNWDAIDAWAKGIAETLSEEVEAVEEPQATI